MNKESDIIRVGGTGADVRIMHITDTHISSAEDANGQYTQFSSRMHNAYSRYDSMGAFRELLEIAKKSSADLIALTGDIVNYPGPNAVNMIAAALNKAGIPWVFIAGNHDWHYEGMPGASRNLRERWREGLTPLYAGKDPHCSVSAIKGLKVVLIDNSTYQVDEQQLAFYDEQVADGMPTILLAHIPLSLPTLRSDGPKNPVCGDPRWGAETDSVWEIERRERWPATGNDISTEVFLSNVIETDNLFGVLCGHIHRERIDPVNGHAKQYSTNSGYDGGYRLLHFE